MVNSSKITALVNALTAKFQAKLVSGNNIKTVNNNSLLGSGNVNLNIPTKTSDLTNDGDGTNVFVKNNDSRLSDARTPTSHTHTKSQISDFPTLHTVATSGSYNDLLNKPVVDSNLDSSSSNAVSNSAVVGGLNDKLEASDISFGFDANTKQIYIELK